jgi:hypothetical protein
LVNFDDYRFENPKVEMNPMAGIFHVLSDFYVKRSANATKQRHAAETSGRAAKRDQVQEKASHTVDELTTMNAEMSTPT